MTAEVGVDVKTRVELSDGAVRANGRALLASVPAELRAEADPSRRGLFLAAFASASSSRHAFGLGSIPDLSRYTVCHRYEPYWMKPRAGTNLADVPPETQFFLAELRGERWLLLVPLVSEPFRFSLRGKKEGTLELLAETGDGWTAGLGGLALFVAIGDDPFRLLEESAPAVSARLGTGRLRRDKKLPAFADAFGWCTWDAFYQEVSAAKVRDGLERFAAGGVEPRMMILDDGWQSTARMPTGESRLTGLDANDKFPGGLASTVRMAKSEFRVETFLVWHSIVGYWGGVDGQRLPDYGVVEQTRQFGEGILAHAPSFNQLWWGNLVGLVPASRIRAFYDDYHRHLRAQGVDGVKVDSQAVLEAVASGQGGRVALTRAYREALEATASEHFEGRLINCMSNAQETWYGSRTTTLLRSSIDFFPSMEETHGAHLYTNAQVGLWFGEFMHPDWDMFQSGHEWGAFHGAGRALSGGPVYVSDKPGSHDFAVLRKLVCSDGTVLRCDRPGLPTLDTILVDPTRDPVVLKIWSRNGAAGVIGAFNAQSGAAGDPPTLHGAVGPADIPGFSGERYAVYAHAAATLEVLTPAQRKAVALGYRGFEIFTIAPVERGLVAPIGLADKWNSAGAVRSTAWLDDQTYEIVLRDGGDFVAWAARAPARAEVDGLRTAFTFESGALRLAPPRGGQRVVRLAW
jgi:raffinose synthase